VASLSRNSGILARSTISHGPSVRLLVFTIQSLEEIAACPHVILFAS